MFKPLITHAHMRDAIAYRNGTTISAAQYLADVHYCAQLLPNATYVLLACQDRYAFAVGFGAAQLRGQSCLMPSTHTEALIAQLASTHANLYCLTDEATCPIALPQTCLSEGLMQHLVQPDQPMVNIPAAHIAAYVFTSGSTGLPLPHSKTWGKLVTNVQSEGKRLGIVNGSQHAIVGTVPPQHMYGFESTVLIALQNGAAFESGKPFYPADIENAIANVPQPRALVTTPFHLRAFITEISTPSPINLLVCATAPLAKELAQEAEDKTKAQLLEIYGSTETSQLATRRTIQTSAWTVFEGIQIHQANGTSYASGLQVEGTVAINDVLELQSPGVFILHGRTADMVNIAGKSTTLDYLNHQLLSIPGVQDGAFLVQSQATEGIGNTARLAVVVVAPSHTPESLQLELRRRVATAFLPRPLKLVEKLPRNGTSKLPREALLALLKNPSANETNL